MISPTEFQHALSAVLMTTGTDELACILFEFTAAQQMRLVSSDGRRITIVDMNVAHAQQPGETFVMHRNSAESLAVSPDMPVTLCLYGGELFINATSFHPAPSFPDYRAALIRNSGTRAARCAYKMAYLWDAIEACRPFVGQADAIGDLEMTDEGPLFIEPWLREGLENVTRIRIAILPVRG